MQVMNIDAESPNPGKWTTIYKVEKLERTVRCSTVIIGALGMLLIALAVYTAVMVCTDYRNPPPCVGEQCVGTSFGVIGVRNALAVNKDKTITKNKMTLIEDTDFGVVGVRNASAVNKDKTITTNNTTLIEDTAARVLQNLNKDVDPCTDFYEFACGGWIKHNPRPAWAIKWDALEKLREQVLSDLRDLLEAKDDEGLPNSVVKAKSLYRTCMNTEKLDADGIKPIQKVLQELGLPPRPPTKMSANFRWEEVAGRTRRQLGLDLLLSMGVSVDVRNTSQYLVEIDQVNPVNPADTSTPFLLQPEQLNHAWKVYHKYIHSMISIADNETNAKQFADHIVEFTKELFKIRTPEEERRNDIFSPRDFTVQQLKEAIGAPPQWKQHDWDRYLKLVFSNTSVTLQPEDRVNVRGLPYLQKLSDLLAHTKPVIIERYLWWMVFSKVAPMTHNEFRSLYFEYLRDMTGQPRWMSCTANLNKIFGHALSYLYVKKHFNYTSTQKAIKMLEDVRSAFAAAVQEVDWMDSTTRQKTLDKLTGIKNLVGFPAWLLTPEQLDKHYEHVEVIEGNLFETYLKMTFADEKKSLESLREKPDRNLWFMPATTINAWYLPTSNSVTIPAAILQPPFYGNGIEAINYGSIGAILGHEITHGFDDQGRCFDEKGNLKEWWSKEALKHFQSRVQCIIDQYYKYPVPQLNNSVNGFNTQGENIADNGGLRAALHAYQLFAKRAPADSRVSLPGLSDYKPDQLFFLGFAQTWCENSTVDALEFQMKDVHSPNKIRVIGTLSNSKEFAEAWSCSAGSPMNPEHKCVLW